MSIKLNIIFTATDHQFDFLQRLNYFLKNEKKLGDNLNTKD